MFHHIRADQLPRLHNSDVSFAGVRSHWTVTVHQCTEMEVGVASLWDGHNLPGHAPARTSTVNPSIVEKS